MRRTKACAQLRKILRRKVSKINSSSRTRFIGRTLDPFRYDHNGALLDSLSPVSEEEVRKIFAEMPAKSSPMDLVPSSMLKSCSSVFSPIITRIANTSFAEGVFPKTIKAAHANPL